MAQNVEGDSSHAVSPKLTPSLAKGGERVASVGCENWEVFTDMTLPIQIYTEKKNNPLYGGSWNPVAEGAFRTINLVFYKVCSTSSPRQ